MTKFCWSRLGSLVAPLGLLFLSIAPASAQEGVGFRYTFGQQDISGELGDVFEGGTDAEFSITVPVLSWLRVGGGAGWASLDVDGADESWSRLRFHALAQTGFDLTPRIRPYAEARWAFRRLRPEDDRYFGGGDRLLRDFAASASGFEGLLGVQYALTDRWRVDLAGAWSSWSLDPDLSQEGFGPVSDADAFRWQLGMSWYPLSSRAEAPVPGTDGVDAWGQPKNFGLAIAGAYLGNFLPWTFNETVPGRADLRISQISPRSWRRNIDAGWKWDDNVFGVNHFAHPFQGNIYYNAARGNGFGYWTSLAFATAGSFHWECCGETHFMSINDWVNTSLGGAAVGETLYRTTSMILDNEARGAERILREAAAFVLNPSRGLARLVSGNGTRVYDNPSNPLDWRPPDVFARFATGVRFQQSVRNGRGGELNESLDPHGFIDVELGSGSLAALDRGKPFDYFTTEAQFNTVRGRGIGRLELTGNLWDTPLSQDGENGSSLVVLQTLSYDDNTAFEQGGQSVSLVYRSRHAGDRSTVDWYAGGGWLVLGGVTSELAFLANVDGIREGFRDYDFGIGPAARAGFAWYRDGARVVDLTWYAQYVATLNGSTLDAPDGEPLGSNHLLNTLRVRAELPVRWNGVTLGADYELFHRRSDFDVENVGLVTQRVDQLQSFLSWTPTIDLGN